MQNQLSFKERVHRQIIHSATVYKEYFIDYEYLVYSSAFLLQPCYIISSYPDNYLHLTGVYTNLSAHLFFQKAHQGVLSIDDFALSPPNRSISETKHYKGTIRRKINALPYIDHLFSSGCIAEESFQKNQIHCTFAASDCNITMGFIHTSNNARPKTLLKGNELNLTKAAPIQMVLRRRSKTSIFDEIIFGDVSCVSDEEIFSFIDLPLHV